MGRNQEEINPAGELWKEMQEVQKFDFGQQCIVDGVSVSGGCGPFFTILCC